MTFASTVIPRAGRHIEVRTSVLAVGSLAEVAGDGPRGTEMKAQLRVLFAVGVYLVEFGGLVALLAVPLGALRDFSSRSPHWRSTPSPTSVSSGGG